MSVGQFIDNANINVIFVCITLIICVYIICSVWNDKE